jgi:hypothetical protein
MTLPAASIDGGPPGRDGRKLPNSISPLPGDAAKRSARAVAAGLRGAGTGHRGIFVCRRFPFAATSNPGGLRVVAGICFDILVDAQWPFAGASGATVLRADELSIRTEV